MAKDTDMRNLYGFIKIITLFCHTKQVSPVDRKKQKLAWG